MMSCVICHVAFLWSTHDRDARTKIATMPARSGLWPTQIRGCVHTLFLRYTVDQTSRVFHDR